MKYPFLLVYVFPDCKIGYDKEKKVIKLHKQLAHLPPHRLQSCCSEMLTFMIMKQGISENCQQLLMCVCAQRRHLHVQSSRFATELNVVAVLDLKECKKGKIWDFHLLDAATKFTLSALIYKFLFISFYDY